MKRIGLSFTGSHDSIDTYIDGTKAAERNGFEVVWLAEDYFFRDSVTIASAVAQATDDIDVGIFVNPYTRHPAMTAVTAASLDEIAGGNLVIAMGAGPRVVMEKFTEYDSPLWATKESVEVIRSLLAEPETSYDGDHFNIDDVTFGSCMYLPYAGEFNYPRTEIPIYLAVTGPQMLKMAGHIGDGLKMPVAFTPEHVEKNLKQAEKGLEMSGRDLDDIDVAGLLVTSDEITQRAREFVAYFFIYRKMENLKLGGMNPDEVEAVREVFHEEGVEEAAKYVTDEMVRTYTIIGDDEERCHRRLDEYVDAGLDLPLLMHLGPSDPETTVEIGASWASSA